MEKGTKEDLKINRRCTCAEEGIVHTDVNIKPIATHSKVNKVQYRTEFLIIAVFLVSIYVGLFYYIHQMNVEMQRQFGEMHLQFVELRSDLENNRRLIEANFTQLATLRSKVEETNTRLDRVIDRLDKVIDQLDRVIVRLDNVADRLGVVENSFGKNPSNSTNFQPDE